MGQPLDATFWLMLIRNLPQPHVIARLSDCALCSDDYGSGVRNAVTAATPATTQGPPAHRDGFVLLLGAASAAALRRDLPRRRN